MIRHQLPVHSPLSAGHLLRGLARAGGSARPRLKRLLTHRFSADRAILFGSGTQALTAAIRLAMEQVGRDRPVALPGFTCYDLASAAVGADASLVLYDVDPATLAPDLHSLEQAFRAGSGVAVLAPLYGYPFDWHAAAALADRYDAILVEDAAQAAGGSWKGRPAGTYGALTTLSFGRGKGWTGGGGGALLLRAGQGAPDGWPGDIMDAAPTPRAARPRREALTWGAAAAQWLLGRPGTYGLPRALPFLHLGETVYHPPVDPGPIAGASAALALATSDAAMAAVNHRRERAEVLHHRVQRTPATPIEVPDGSFPGYLRFPCLLEGARQHPRLREMARLGLETGYPTTLAGLDVVRSRLSVPAAVPGAQRLAATLVTLPTHAMVRQRDLDALLALLGE
ncbi:MAG TPA: DegT/DnrJ/EryC1/StrS family aminotransferase [Longimicrobiales bacterium]|nr:DegT/DnrJ/EryC1/StrS family aminotransferase [Longimicrobiales bacterium]